MIHPAAADLEAYKRRALPTKELLAVDDHLAACEECRRAVAAGVTNTKAWQRTVEAVRGEHVPYFAIERYANGELSPDEREALSAHAGLCSSCAREIEDLEAYARTLAPRPWRWWAVAAAAVLLVAALSFLLRDRQVPAVQRPTARQHDPTPATPPTPALPAADPIDSLAPPLRRVAEAVGSGTLPAAALLTSLQPPREHQRSTGVPAEAEVRLLEPTGTVIETDRPTFRWNRSVDGAEVIVQVFDRAYALVAESSPSSRTSWRVDRPLQQGATYRWQLRVQSKDGRSTTVPAPPAPPALFHIIGREASEELREARRLGSELEAGLICMREGLVAEGARLLALHAAENPDSAPAQRLAANAALIAKSPPERTTTSSTGG